eukprot:2978651-Ditylum_brightwellii.AAC.1
MKGEERKEKGINNRMIHEKLLIHPLRYANTITAQSKPSSTTSTQTKKSKLLLPSKPPKDVQEVIRCGYGDFVTWCGLVVSPLDPLIFDHVCNYPDDEDDQAIGCWGLNE